VDAQPPLRRRRAGRRAALAVLLLTVFAGAPAGAGETIRIAVLEGAASVEVGGGPLAIASVDGRSLGAGTPSWLRLHARPGGVEVRGAPAPLAPAIRVVSARGGAVRVNARDYPGIIEVWRTGQTLLVVNELALEDYLAGSVKAEAGEAMPVEMLKAQAIVARTYAAYHRRLNAGKPYHLVASTAHQQYAGAVAPDSPIWTAVRETRGQVLLWQGEVFPAFYHTDSGGHTEDPRVVFAATNMPALPPVRVEFPSDSPHHVWSLDLSLADIGALLRRGGVAVGRIIGLEVLERSVSLRVARILVQGSHGSAMLRGNDFRRLLGYDALKSTLFAVVVDGAVARFAGRGYGHGVGLDQSGAKTMALLGYGAAEILAYYYPGVGFGSLR
jgi:stage II sporulation protein D